jgi:unsaturated rhamnogalacturonyl hydrolase
MKGSAAAAGVCLLLLLAARDVLAGSERGRPLVLLDNFYNNEWKTDSAGRRYPYHYLWCDTMDSGFSRLGGLVRDLGFRTDTLCRAPAPDALRRAAIYMIVDPDTPKETDYPEVIGDRAAADIASWVREGGVLLLLGNDKGNAEFEHLNGLAGRFGIRFNEDSRNRVTGEDYEAGTFSAFPPHPLFVGVRKIYLKEIATLSLAPPAQPVLVDGGDVIIAFAPYGKGLVLAVGDPWLYNEYIDHRKLPAEYGNALAASNLFRWLGSGAWRPGGRPRSAGSYHEGKRR